MAPEVLLGERHGTPVDLWALGCLAFELLTGYTPFTGESVAEIFEHILQHAHGDAVRWPEEEDHLSSSAVDFVWALLEPLPERRLGGAGTHEAFAELRAALFLLGIDWGSLQSREGVAPFVPTLVCSRRSNSRAQLGQPLRRPGSCALPAPARPPPVESPPICHRMEAMTCRTLWPSHSPTREAATQYRRPRLCHAATGSRAQRTQRQARMIRNSWTLRSKASLTFTNATCSSYVPRPAPVRTGQTLRHPPGDLQDPIFSSLTKAYAQSR